MTDRDLYMDALRDRAQAQRDRMRLTRDMWRLALDLGWLLPAIEKLTAMELDLLLGVRER